MSKKKGKRKTIIREKKTLERHCGYSENLGFLFSSKTDHFFFSLFVEDMSKIIVGKVF